MGNVNCTRQNKDDPERECLEAPLQKQSTSQAQAGNVDNEDGQEKGNSQTDFEQYIFPFENIVFEGGGSKSLAYCGAIKVLEEAGIWGRTKRLCGSGTGAMMAALCSVGYNSTQLENFLTHDMRRMFNDKRWGYLSLLPALLRTYGWNPGQRILNWFGDRFKETTGKPDITFLELYQMFGKELCIVVTNLNQMSTEFFHPKTTPDLPVRVAIRMSMAIPGLFRPIKYQVHAQESIYVEGGLLCNYPIHSFDGWWLSMESHDAFIKRIRPIQTYNEKSDDEERFGSYTNKTIGFLLYSDDEKELFQDVLVERLQTEGTLPDTQLAITYKDKNRKLNYTAVKHQELATAVDKFLEALKAHRLDKSKSITKNDLQNALKKVRSLCEGTELTDDDLKALFGDKISPEYIFVQIDPVTRDTITYPELVGYLERKGLHLQSEYLDCKRTEIKGLRDYVLAVHDTMQNKNKWTHVKKKDIERTVGINTCYIGPNAFDMELEDKNFLIQQGERATRAFLEHYIATKRPPLDTEGRESFSTDDLAFYMDDCSEIIDLRDYRENFVRGII